MATVSDLFGDVIHAYTRADALRDGALVDVSKVAREAGIRYPVAMTADAYADCVAWTDADARRKGGGCHQDPAGRLWDVVYMLSHAIRTGRVKGDRGAFQVLCVPREGRGVKARLVTLQAVCGPGDDGAPVLTIMLPGED